MSAVSGTSEEQVEYLHYRSLSLLAVATFALAILAVPALIMPWLLAFPLLGLIVGFLAIRSIRERPREIAGLSLAWIGTLLNLVLLATGSARASYVYATEVPEGYQRVSFNELQPDDERSDLPVPPYAIGLNEQRVFVKGYVYPDDRGAQLKQFVLIPDLGTCCFGGQPKLTDMIEVSLKDPLRTRYSRRKHKLGGILRVDTRIKPISGLEGVYYRLDADYLNGDFAQ
jgi:hypothetical protein